ncbi:MAG: ribosome maturation factor RimM, partial [Bacteroidales bacterium]
IDGIFVPFFIEDYRFRSDTAALIKFEDIDDDTSARVLINREIYFPKKHIVHEDIGEEPADYFLGYKVVVSGRYLGDITEIDDTTANVLFTVVAGDGRDYLIPATDDFVENIDEEGKIINMNIPEGLLDI